MWKNSEVYDIVNEMGMIDLEDINRMSDAAEVKCGPVPPKSTCHPLKEPCLFNIVEDPCEYNNLAHSHPEILERLTTVLEAYNATAVPPKNCPLDPKADPKLHDNVWTWWADQTE